MFGHPSSVIDLLAMPPSDAHFMSPIIIPKPRRHRLSEKEIVLEMKKSEHDGFGSNRLGGVVLYRTQQPLSDVASRWANPGDTFAKPPSHTAKVKVGGDLSGLG